MDALRHPDLDPFSMRIGTCSKMAGLRVIWQEFQCVVIPLNPEQLQFLTPAAVCPHNPCWSEWKDRSVSIACWLEDQTWATSTRIYMSAHLLY